MKVFEKWFKAYHDGRMATVRGTAKDSWQAALEFVKSRIFEHEDVLDVIEQELDG